MADTPDHMRLLARHLVRTGYDDLPQNAIDATKLELGLREQLVRKLHHVAMMPPETTYAYYHGFDALHDWGGVASRGSGLGSPGPGNTPLSRITARPPMISATITTSGTHARERSLKTAPPD